MDKFHILFIFLIIQLIASTKCHTWESRPETVKQMTRSNHYNRYQQTPLSSDTQYKYKTVQTGSAIIPYSGARVYVAPDRNQTKSFIKRVDTRIINPRVNFNQKFERKSHRRNHYNHLYSNKDNLRACVKCPSLKSIIAPKGFDGVIIEPPAAISCSTNKPYSNALYTIETLFTSSNLKFLLPEGSHSIFGRIVNQRGSGDTGIEHTCQLKYNIIVRRCGDRKYRPKNRQLKVTCDLDNIWGSKCSFICRNGGILSHQQPIECNYESEWIGEEPRCYDPVDTNKNPKMNGNSCKLPIPPENGKFSCEIANEIDSDNNIETTPSGTICRVNCNGKFTIPKYLQYYTTFYCDQNGFWNSTMMNFCQ